MMGGHLPNSEGNIIGDGDDVVHSFDDIKKLKPYDVSKCMRMKNILRTIELMRAAERRSLSMPYSMFRRQLHLR